MVVIVIYGYVVFILNFFIWFYSIDVEKWYLDFEEYFVENILFNVKSRIRVEKK